MVLGTLVFPDEYLGKILKLSEKIELLWGVTLLAGTVAFGPTPKSNLFLAATWTTWS